MRGASKVLIAVTAAFARIHAVSIHADDPNVLDPAVLDLAIENSDMVLPLVDDRPADISPFNAGNEKTSYSEARLWLGNRKVAESKSALNLLGVTHVVNAASTQGW